VRRGEHAERVEAVNDRFLDLEFRRVFDRAERRRVHQRIDAAVEEGDRLRKELSRRRGDRECEGCGDPCGRKWCSEECRKRTKYGGTCEKCGATTNGSNGPGTAAKVCIRCVGENRRQWTKEAIIKAMLDWNLNHGEQPRSTQWQRATPGVHPATSTVGNVFGTWNAGIEAAGLTPMKGGPPAPPPAPTVHREPAPTLPSDSPLRRGESNGPVVERKAEGPAPNTPEANRARVNAMRSR
jgi:hypothetical protein